MFFVAARASVELESFDRSPTRVKNRCGLRTMALLQRSQPTSQVEDQNFEMPAGTPSSPLQVENGRLDLGFIETGQNILIGYHGGCPDGAFSAYMLSKTLLRRNESLSISNVPIGHQNHKFSSAIQPGMVVFSLDITPSLDDVEALRSATIVVILDHHASEEETQSRLTKLCPNVHNFSNNAGTHCATSMVSELSNGICEFDEDIVSMVHKMDVFAFQLPSRLENEFLGFKAYLTQRGERNVQLDLVEEMFGNKTKCVDEGRKLQAAMIQRTDELADAFEIICETDDWRVLFAAQSAPCRPIDLMHYQQRIDAHIVDKRTLVLTQDLVPLPSGLFNLGLRRAGANLNVVDVAANFKRELAVASGGGHPFAGGVQCRTLLSRQEVVDMAFRAMQDLP